MATQSYSSIGGALGTRFADEVTSVINRACVLAQLLEAKPADGKNISWTVKMGDASATSTAYIGDGTDVSTFNRDLKVPAYLEYARYHDAFTVTGFAELAAAAAGNPAQLANLLFGELQDSAERLAKAIAEEIYTGTGATNRIHGLLASGAPAIGATGAYANINPATSGYEQWAGNEVDALNAPISFDLLRQLRRAVTDASGKKFDLFVCDSVQHDAIGALFGQERRYVDQVRLADGSQIKLSGGYNVLEFDGIPIVEDLNCPAGYVLGLNTKEIFFKQMDPDALNAMFGDQAGSVQLGGTAEEQFGKKMMGLRAKVTKLARSGDATKIALFTYPQLVVRQRNAHGFIKNLDTSP